MQRPSTRIRRSRIIEPLEPRVLLSGWATVDEYPVSTGFPSALTADPAGDVYEVGGGTVREQLAGTNTWTTIDNFADLNLHAATSDAAGDIFVAGNTNVASSTPGTWVVMEQAAGRSSFSVIDRFFLLSENTSCEAIAVDSAGDVFAAGEQLVGAPSYAIDWIVRERAADQSAFTTVDDFGGDGQAEARGVTAISSGPNAGVYVVGAGGTGSEDWLTRKSSDGGKTWTTVDTVAPSGSYSSNAAAYGIAADRAGNLYVSGTMYGLTSQGQGDLLVVRESRDGGATWSDVDEYAIPSRGSQGPWIGTDPAGNVYTVGSANIGPGGSTSMITRSNAGGTWATVDEFQTAPGEGTFGQAFAADGLGNLYTLSTAMDPSGNETWILRTARAPSSAPAPTVVGPVALSDSASIDANQTQRSEVRNLTVTFSEPVILGGDPFSLQLLNTGGSGSNDGSAPTDASAALGTPVQVADSNGTQWAIPILPNTPFSDATGSLDDGTYTLTVNASAVTSGGTPMVADYVSSSFHRLSGDITGDGKVGFSDLLVLAQNYGKTGATIDDGDLNENGIVDFPDLLILAQNYGHSLTAAVRLTRRPVSR